MEKRQNNRPDFIIIGAMKCATSTLHDQLNMHSSFFMTHPKEPNFFSNDEIYAKGFQWYESLFSQASPDQLRGESSTHYTKLPQYPKTLERITTYCPGIKCIYIVRHPIDRLISHYIHEWTQGVISCDIDQAVKKFPELIEYSRYNMQIEPFLDYFGSSSVLPIFAERLRDNPLLELQRVFNFLEVTELPVWNTELTSNVSAKRLRASPWRDKIVNNTLSRYLRRRFVPKSFRRKIRGFWTMKERPIPSKETLKALEIIFNKDLHLFGQKLGIHLNCSNFKAQILHHKDINWSR
jgi:hypothetical protein